MLRNKFATCQSQMSPSFIDCYQLIDLYPSLEVGNMLSLRILVTPKLGDML
jgi:hypothetical protein